MVRQSTLVSREAVSEASDRQPVGPTFVVMHDLSEIYANKGQTIREKPTQIHRDRHKVSKPVVLIEATRDRCKFELV